MGEPAACSTRQRLALSLPLRPAAGAIAARVCLCLCTIVLSLATGASGDGTCASSLHQLKDRFPYMSSIRQMGSRAHVCSGVLISSNVVITAAHCVDPDSVYSAGRKPIVHIIGNQSIDEVDANVQVSMTQSSIIHPNWDKSQRSPFNIALLLLADKVERDVPVVLNDHISLKTGQGVHAVGWGKGGSSISVGSDIFGDLKTENQEYIEGRQCNKPSIYNGTLNEALSCGINEEQKASCLVDSGAPLMVLDMPKLNIDQGLPTLDFLIGLNIDGAPCGTNNKPDVYIDLRKVHPWISKHTGI